MYSEVNYNNSQHICSLLAKITQVVVKYLNLTIDFRKKRANSSDGIQLLFTTVDAHNAFPTESGIFADFSYGASHAKVLNQPSSRRSAVSSTGFFFSNPA